MFDSLIVSNNYRITAMVAWIWSTKARLWKYEHQILTGRGVNTLLRWGVLVMYDEHESGNWNWCTLHTTENGWTDDVFTNKGDITVEYCVSMTNV